MRKEVRKSVKSTLLYFNLKNATTAGKTYLYTPSPLFVVVFSFKVKLVIRCFRTQ